MSAILGSDRGPASRYQPVRVLKAGNGVETLLAVDAANDAQVVLKVVQTDALSPEACTRLEHEAMVLRDLRSPWLAPLLEVAHDGDQLYLVMPFVPGVTLRERLSAGPLGVGETLTVVRCLLGALAELHGHGIVHCDVKPGKVMVDNGAPLERATLIDYGYARRASLAVPFRNVPAGTARYMAPELAGLIGRDVDQRTDLYSLGIVAFECLVGEPPFDADDVGELLRQHLSAPPSMLRSLDRSIPGSLDEIVQRLLRKDPDDRYQSAGAALADLDDLAELLERGISGPQVVVGAHDRRQTLTEPVLIGREGELAALGHHLEDARSGRGRLVMVEAESGGGKTRLLDEFCRQATGEGVLVLRGHGVDRVATGPLQVLTGLAADLLAATKRMPQLAGSLRDKLGHHRAPLCRLLPELGEILDPLSEAEGPEAYGPTRGVEALVALLEALGSSAHPALVVLDDCQWIDELSVRVLLSWAGRDPDPVSDRPGPHALVVVAARREELTDRHPLRQLEDVTRIELEPLSKPQIRGVVESMAGQIPAEAVEVVVSLSGGSPFMVLAVLRGLVESGALSPTREGWRFEPSSEGVQASRQAAAFLARRLELLAPVSRRLLAAGAVLGRQFDIRIAAMLAGDGEAEARSAVTQAVQRHVVWRGDGNRFTFVHDRLREMFLEGLDPVDLSRLHHRAAEEIERADPSRAFELSYHFDAAGRPERALHHALSSADVARARNDFELAERHYRIAERGVSGADVTTRRKLAVEFGQLLMLRGRYDEANKRLESALSLADGDIESARIQCELGELAFKRDDIDDATAWIEGALRKLNEPVPRGLIPCLVLAMWEFSVRLTRRLPATRWLVGRRRDPGDERRRLAAQLYARLLYAWFFSRRGTLATVWLMLRQVNAAERCPRSREFAHAYGIYGGGMAAAFPVLWKRGLRYVDEAKALHDDLGDRWGVGQALGMRAVVLCGAGRFSEGEETASQAMALLQRAGDPWELNWAAFHRAQCLLRMGDTQGAIRQARMTHQLAVALGDAQAEATTLEIWAKATDGLLSPELVRAALRKAAGDIQTTTALLQAEALQLRARDRLDDAVHSAEQAVILARKARVMNMYLVTALPWLATLYRESVEEALLPGLRRRRMRLARQAARRARRYAIVYRNERPHALRESAMIAALGGRNRRARRLFAASEAVALRQQAHGELIETLRLRGRVANLLDWPEPAHQPPGSTASFERINPEVPDAAREGSLGLAERFESLLAAGGPLVSAGSSDEIATAVRDAAMVLLRPEKCCVVGLGPRGGSGDVEEGDPAWEVGQALFRRALEERRPVVFNESPNTSAGDDSPDGMVMAGFRSALCAPILVQDEVLGYVLATHSGVTGLFGEEEQRLAEFVIHLAGAAIERERLRQTMRARVVAAQEAERARIARDLHDEIGQAITSVLLGVRLVRNALDGAPLDREHLRERTDEVREVATDALGRVQRLAFELRPTVLDDLGLIAALRRLVGDVSVRYGIEVDFAVSDLAPTDRLVPDVETTAYRVVQEALTNVVRHARASSCSVVLARVQGRLRLVVVDNGSGFEPDGACDGSLGLRGMTERAALVGGVVRITSSPGEGTVVVAEIPID